MPEYIRKNVKRPTNGSVITLNANAENGSVSDEWRSVFVPSSISPSIAFTSIGDGK